MVAIVEGNGFISSRNATSEDADAGYLGLVCDAYTAGPIFHSRDLTSATGAVVIAVPVGGGERVMVVEIVRILCVLK